VSPGDSADLLILDADIRTGDPAAPRARALAVRDGRIVAIGEAPDVRTALASSAPAVSFAGRTVTPGFHDAHTHLAQCATARARLDLAGADARADVIARVRARHAAQAPGTWIRGEDLAPFSAWSEPPDRRDLDAAAPDRAIVLTTRDRHAALASSAALGDGSDTFRQAASKIGVAIYRFVPGDLRF
jgi:predicted amidohydrolase YtcJ